MSRELYVIEENRQGGLIKSVVRKICSCSEVCVSESDNEKTTLYENGTEHLKVTCMGFCSQRFN
jgi:hypothetical protein